MEFSILSKRLVKKALLSAGVARIAARFRPPSAAILAYHSVQEDPEDYANTIGVNNIHSTSVFRSQMELVARKFHPITVDDILLFLTGEKQLPPRSVAVTFDDGYLDNFELVAPVLERYGIRGAFYVMVDAICGPGLPWFIRLRHAFWTTRLKTWREPGSGAIFALGDLDGRREAFLAACCHCAKLVGVAQEQLVRSIECDLDAAPVKTGKIMMGWDEVRRLRAAGHTVGSHTLCHPNVAFIRPEEALHEFTESKRRLEERLGGEVRHFSYPHPVLDPNYTEETAIMSREAGFRSGVTTVNAPVDRRQNAWSLPRLYTLRHPDDFRWHLEKAFVALHDGRSKSYEG
ncbi:MAG: polysaccharide deacetylase family protein [Terriglobia bacterium]